MPPAGERRALLHAQQAHALAGRRPQPRRRDVETPTVVAHLHTQLLLRSGERNPNFARLRVARDIGEGFLSDAKARGLDLWGETRGHPLMREIRLEPGAACLPVEMRAQRRPQSKVVQLRGSQVARYAAHLLARLVDRRNAFGPARALVGWARDRARQK